MHAEHQKHAHLGAFSIIGGWKGGGTHRASKKCLDGRSFDVRQVGKWWRGGWRDGSRTDGSPLSCFKREKGWGG